MISMTKLAGLAGLAGLARIGRAGNAGKVAATQKLHWGKAVLAAGSKFVYFDAG